MERISQVARETGYLDGIQEFRSVDVYGHLPPDKVVALCTGSQGEPRAALSRIAQDEHPDVAFSRGDRVIFSSRAIPGNEKAVMRVINGLVTQGIEVITDRTHLVHVSGHPRVERARGHDWLGAPADPAAGARRAACTWPSMPRWRGASASARWCCAATASSCGSRRANPARSTRCRRGGSTRTARCWSAPRSALSPTAAGSALPASCRLRSRSATAASWSPIPRSSLTGVPEADAQGQRIEDIAYDAVLEAFESMPRARRRDPEAVAEAVRRAVRAALSSAWNKKPTCHVHVLEV